LPRRRARADWILKAASEERLPKLTLSGNWAEQGLTPATVIPVWIIAMTVMLATFMEVLDTSVANVALPHIAGSLSASMDESTWMLTSYLVANAIILPMGGWFSMLFGRKRFYMICVALFTISSFLCGMAPSLGALIFFRVLQGIGGGALQPISQAILVESFPREKQGMAMAVYGMGVVVAPVIGPTLGGWITDNYTWRWIFFINIPVGRAVAGAHRAADLRSAVPQAQELWATAFKIDYTGFGLLALGLGALEVVLDEGQKEDWFGSHFIVTFAIITRLPGRRGLLGVAAERTDHRFPHVERPQLRAGHACHAGAGVRALCQHRAAAPVPANAAGLHRHDERPGALARRTGDRGLHAGGGHAGAQVSAALAGDLRRAGHGIGLFRMARFTWDRLYAPRSGAAWCRARAGVPVRADQRHGGCDSQGAHQLRHRLFQPGAQHRRQFRNRHRDHAAGAPRADFISRCWWRISRRIDGGIGTRGGSTTATCTPAAPVRAGCPGRRAG
jgi:hypothetical protein